MLAASIPIRNKFISVMDVRTSLPRGDVMRNYQWSGYGHAVAQRISPKAMPFRSRLYELSVKDWSADTIPIRGRWNSFCKTPTYSSDSWCLVILALARRTFLFHKRLTMTLAAPIRSNSAVHADTSASEYQCLAFALVQETLDVRYRGRLRYVSERVDVSRRGACRIR